MLLGQVLAGENLVLAHVHADDGVVVQLGAQLADRGAGEHGAGAAGELTAQLGLAEVGQHSPPLPAVGGVYPQVQNLPQDHFHVSHQGDGGLHVLADLRRVHVDVDGGHPPLNFVGFNDGPVGRPGTHHDEQVGLGQGLVGAVVTVGPDHAHVQGVVGRHDGNAHHGLDQRDACALHQLQQLRLGAGQPDAAAGADNGLFGLADGLRHPLDLEVVAFDAGLVAPDVHRLRPVEGL